LRAGRRLGRGLNAAGGSAGRRASLLLLRGLGLLLHRAAGSALIEVLFDDAQALFAS
jgi:hypothetical protein